MARFMISMPDDMLKKLDKKARDEHRSRSELLREAARRHLAAMETETPPRPEAGKQKGRKKWTKNALRQYLLERGAARKGCPGLDPLLGPVKGPVDMKRVLKIGKKLAGLSSQIIADRENRA